MAAPSSLPWLGAAPSLPPPGRRAPTRRRLPVRRIRQGAAAALAAAGVWAGISVVAPQAPPHQVLTATSDLPAGHVLTGADLTPSRVDAQLLPSGAITATESSIGRRLGRPVVAHEILTDAALTTSRALRPDERAVHVPVADPGALTLARAGDVVDLVEAGGGRVVATAARVIAVDDPSGDKNGHGMVLALPASRLRELVPAMSANGPGVTPILRNS